MVTRRRRSRGLGSGDRARLRRPGRQGRSLTLSSEKKWGRSRGLAAALALLLLAGCATPRPAVKVDATAAELARGEACHLHAVAYAKEAAPYLKPAPPREWSWWDALEILRLPALPEGLALVVATSPVWVPWWLTAVHRERREAYAREYAACLAEPAAAAEPAEKETTR